MQVVCIDDDNKFMVLLNDDEVTLIGVYAQVGHTSTEEIIEEWLDAALTKYVQYIEEKESRNGMERQDEGMGRG